MPRPRRSSAWKYFNKKNNGFAVCKFCGKQIKTSGNTSNLLCHIERVHKHHTEVEQESDILAVAEVASTPESATSDREATPGPRHSTSSSSSTLTMIPSDCADYGKLSNCTDTDTPKSSLCTKSLTIARSFKDIMAFKRGGGKEIELNNAILFLLCKENLPLSLVESIGFKHLLHKTTPLYKVPCRKTFSKLLCSKYEILRECLKKKLENIQVFSMTTDIWTEQHQTKSYLGVTLHYLYNTEMKSVTAGVYPLEERHTSGYISKKLEECLEELGLPKTKIMGVVTDNGANIVKAICETFSEIKHLPCFAHTLNLVAENSLQGDLEITNLISKVKTIVTWFKKSTSATDMLRQLQLDNGVSESHFLKLKQQVPTRWNSTFYMIDRFLNLHKYVGQILLNDKKAPLMLNGTETAILKELKILLKPLEVCTKELCAEKHVSISKIIPLVHCMRKAIEKFKPQEASVANFKEILLAQLTRRFGLVEKVDKLAIATLLDPRFKKIHFEDHLAVGHAVNIIKKKLKERTIETVEKQANVIDKPMEMEDTNDSIENIWDFHNSLVHDLRAQANQAEKDDVNMIISSEITHYFNSCLNPLDQNPFEAWKILSLSYPHLHSLAEEYLQHVATSVPSERLFSKAGDILNEKRSRLKPDTLNKMAFLNSLETEDWNL